MEVKQKDIFRVDFAEESNGALGFSPSSLIMRLLPNFQRGLQTQPARLKLFL